ncbi:hypothetical protein WT27_28870 [Burkholderia territorii]|uniref:DNA-binding protein H-NS-like C-terminal domain-containing protein n=1 Tax=Burkholderia territorii TaxID=1503055 RepID=A0A105VRK5_9BURK|nr:hypothetical protein WT27_28870 [Burkholderia territorii]KVX41332.1 hypothetical protein WT31_29725 [Burkholderia territorii]
MRKYGALLAQYEELRRELDLAREREIRQVVERVLAALEASGITYTDLVKYGRSASVAPTRGAPKYWNRETGETWSGRGRAPHWIRGRDRAAFLLPVSESAPEQVGEVPDSSESHDDAPTGTQE